MIIHSGRFKAVNKIVLLLALLGATMGGDAYAIFAHRASNGEDLGVMILGGIVHSVGRDNVALLKETRSGRVFAAKIGQAVFGKYIVRAITRRYLLFETKEAEIILVYQNKFERDFKEIGSSYDTGGNSRLALGAPTEEYATDGFERRANRIRMTQAFRDNLLKNELGKVLMQATALPYIEGNEIKGFSLTEIIEDSIYQHAGFQVNDIITSINGVPLNDVSSTVRLLNSLKTATQVEIEIRRDGRSMSLSASIE
jgi:membrane-associated protease RseP (regulator of RpoE activity)